MDVVTGEAKCSSIRLCDFADQGRRGAIYREAPVSLTPQSLPSDLTGINGEQTKMCRRDSHSAEHYDATGGRNIPGGRGCFRKEFLILVAGRTIGQSTRRCLARFRRCRHHIGYDAVEYCPSLWNKGRNRPIVHIDVTSANIENDYSPAVELIGSIEETLAALSDFVHRPTFARVSADLLQLIAHDRERLMAEAAAKSSVPVHPMRLISELQKILTPDVTVCSDMGTVT